MTKFFIKDPEAAAYMLESFACLVENLGAGNYPQALLDAVSFAGWVKNAF